MRNANKRLFFLLFHFHDGVPSTSQVSKYTLAQGYDDRFGGELAHVVVMQHVSSEKIDMFIDDLVEEQPTGV